MAKKIESQSKLQFLNVILLDCRNVESQHHLGSGETQYVLHENRNVDCDTVVSSKEEDVR